MYLIQIQTNGSGVVIHEPGPSGVKVEDASISREVNKFDSLSFTMYPDNPGWDSITPFATTVTVTDTRRGAAVFDGRVIQRDPAMGDDGTPGRSVTCESVMGYLCDSSLDWEDEEHYDDVGSTTGLQLYLGKLLDAHNSKVEEHKRIQMGEVTLQTFETSGGVTKGVSRGSTWDNVSEKILDVFGGEMRVRRDQSGILRLDYAERLGQTRATRIELGRNLVEHSGEMDPSSVITRLYPFGAKLKETVKDPDTGEDTEVETEKRITIESVNGGVPYIDDEEGIASLGVIEGYHEWDDVTVPANLKAKAQAWLGENNRIPVTHSISALDLSLLGLDPDSFEIFDSYPCHNPLTGLDETLEIVKQTIDINEPEASTFDMGDGAARLSDDLSGTATKGDVEYVQSQISTSITNVENRLVTNMASLAVDEDAIVAEVTQNVQSTITEKVEEEVQQATTDTIVGASTEWYLSTSRTELVGGMWSPDEPQVTTGLYVWTRTKWVTLGREVSYSAAACVTGNDGQPGQDGAPGQDGESVGVEGHVTSYAVGDSGTAPPSDGWRATIPMAQPGQWLWTRVVVTFSDDSSYTQYSAAYQGEDGTDGADGLTYHLHIAYANDATGSTGFSTTDGSGKLYLGQCVDTSESDPTDPSAYTWTLIKGDDGQQGVQGPPGSDGQTLYTWVKYADDASGSGMSDSPDGKEYIGLAYNKTSQTESGVASDYAWSKIVGEQGPQGPTGPDGQTLYTWVKYADSATGSGMSDSPSGKSYIGLAYNKTSATEGSDPSDYTWSLIKGSDGRSIEDVDVEFYLSDSKTSQTGGSWSTAQPQWESGTYLWTRTVITYDDGSVERTTPQVDTSWEAASDVEESLSGQIGDIQQTVTTTTNRVTTLEQTADGWDFQFQTVTEEITNLGDQVSTQYYEQLKYIKFENGEIWLGRDPDPGQDDFKVVISNERIRFLQSGVEVAYLSNNKLYVTSAQILSDMQLGAFAFFPRKNGSLSFRLK